MSAETSKAPLQCGDASVADDECNEGSSYYGVIKSYNERRGFGFIACEDTARLFGRDVYLSKEEAVILAKEPLLAISPTSGSGDGCIPPIKEGDFLQFQVQKSTEGYPQAVNARRLRRLRGTVVRPAEPGNLEGCIVIKGDSSSSSSEAAFAGDGSVKQMIGHEICVRQADCGHLRLAVNDEVAFCCAAVSEGSPQMLEARLIELLSTSRTGVAMLGCFLLELPRVLDFPEAAADEGASQPSAVLQGYGLADRVVLAGLPQDLEAAELMRLFGKLGASEATVSRLENAGWANGFATVSFPNGPIDIARMLVRAAHTINEQGATQLARLSSGAPHGVDSLGAPLLPALPVPTLVPDGDALMVRWSQVSVAAGYLVELRPVGEDAAWSSVDVAAGILQEVPGGVQLPSGLLGPQCAACRVNSMRLDVPYEARVTFFTAWGCKSQASAPSPPCTIHTGSTKQSVSSTPHSPIVPGTLQSNDDASRVHLTDFDGGDADAAAHGLHPSAQFMPPGGNLMMPPPVGWRAPSGNLIPPPAAPELIPFDEVGGGRSILIQWPTIVHATAYIVELYEETSGTLERFHRVVPDNLREVLVELRVGNLQPAGSYGACVRSVAPCGCESSPSPWSFAPPSWFPPPLPMAGWPGAMPPQVNAQQPHPAQLQSPSPLLATNPGSAPTTGLPPPPPSDPPAMEGAASELEASAPTTTTGGHVAPASGVPASGAEAPGVSGADALVLD